MIGYAGPFFNSLGFTSSAIISITYAGLATVLTMDVYRHSVMMENIADQSDKAGSKIKEILQDAEGGRFQVGPDENIDYNDQHGWKVRLPDSDNRIPIIEYQVDQEGLSIPKGSKILRITEELLTHDEMDRRFRKPAPVMKVSQASQLSQMEKTQIHT